MWQAYIRLRCWSSANIYGALYDDPVKRKLLKPAAQWEVEQGRTVTGTDVSHLLAARLHWYQAFISLFETHDFLVTPTAQVFAFDAKTHWPIEIASKKMDSYLRWMQVCGAITMTGCPALAMPAGFDDQGRSMGIQIVGRPRQEIDCLKIANVYDCATRWPSKHPPPLARA